MKKQQAEISLSGGSKGVDVLIFAEGSGKVLKCLPDVSGPTGGSSEGEQEVDEFISRSRPRYIFFPTSRGTSGYAEAVPFGWTGVSGGKEERWTRVVRLDRFAEDSSEVVGVAVGKGEKGEKKKVSRFIDPGVLTTGYEGS